MSEFKKLAEKQAELKAKRNALAAIMAEAGPEMDMDKIKSIDGDATAKVDHIRGSNEEITALGTEVEDLKFLKSVADMAMSGDAESESGASDTGHEGVKSLGEMFTSSKAYSERGSQGGPEVSVDFDVKTLFQTSAGFAPETVRTGRLVDFATRPLQIADLIPTVPTTQAAVVYMEETTYTNAAAEVLEGGLYPEAALVYTEKSSPVRKIAVWLPVTDEQLEDVPSIQARINNRLPFMIRQRLDSQILVGDGIAPNLEGIVRTGSQTVAQAVAPDNAQNAIFRAMTLVETGAFGMADTIVVNPADWQKIRLARTTDGIYLWGSPADAGPERIWGTRVVRAFAQAAGTAIVFDSSQIELAVRKGMDVQISNSHSDFFVNGKQAIRADMRVGLQVYRPASVVTVTALA